MLDFSVMRFETNNSIKANFNFLPNDPYLKPGDGNFRLRKFHTGYVNEQYLKWDGEPHCFEQSMSLNTYAGGMKREYHPVDSFVLDYVGETLILPNLNKLPENSYSINIHQIRIITNDLLMGKPAPEGLHQDGFDFIIVFCLATENIVGGNSLLFSLTNSKHSIIDCSLEPGQAILFNDKKYRHYVSPIAPRLPGSGYRDVFVATFKKREKSQH